MKKHFRFLFPVLILFGIISFAACDFEPTGNHFVEVDPNVPPLVFDIELNWNKDTIWHPANQSINFNYSFVKHNKKFLQAFFVVDDSLHKTFENYSIHYRYYPASSQKVLDTHRVEFEAHFAAGTGSLADQAELERFIVKKEWVIISYDIERLDMPKIRVEKIDGELKISWEKPPIDSISSYRLTKFVLDGYNCPEVLTVYSSIDSTSFIDPHYIGENANYQLILKAGSNKAYYYPECRYNGSFPKLQYETINDTTLRLFWNKCEYPLNFDAYLINVSYPGDTITDINTTSVIVDNYFYGSDRNFRLNVKPKKTHYYQITYYSSDNYCSKLSLMNGLPSFEFWFGYSAGKNHIVLNDSYSDYFIYNLNNGNTQILKSHQSSSSGGQYIVYAESDYVEVVRDLNINNNQKLSTEEITGGAIIPEAGKREIDRLSVSDNGILAATDYGTVYFYDIQNSQFLFSHKFDGKRLTGMQVSPDGKYLAVTLSNEEYHIYNTENNELVFLTETGKHRYLLFDPEESSKLVIQGYDDKKIEYLNLSPYSVIAEMETSDDLISVDFYNNKFATRGYISVSEYSFDSWELLKKVPVSGAQYANFYKNGVIYIRDGIKFKLGN